MERAGISAAALREALGTRYSEIDVVDETGSTNADLLTRRTAPDRTVLLAEFQTAGRGRLDRVWTSPPRAGLTFSVLLRPTAPLTQWGWLPLLAGVAVRQAVLDCGAEDASLKWPNDLLLGRKQSKVAGILAQASADGDGVVIGIGLNVSTTADEFGDVEGISLEMAGAHDVDRTALLVQILTYLDRLAAGWSDVGGDAEACGLAAAYRAACSTLGREVTVLGTNGSDTTGIATDVDREGRLLLDVHGKLVRIAAGDVRHARPIR